MNIYGGVAMAYTVQFYALRCIQLCKLYKNPKDPSDEPDTDEMYITIQGTKNKIINNIWL